MARMPRVVVPGMALHVIQRGNNRQAVFYSDDDYRKYLEVLHEAAIGYGCSIHAYVLMTNHVHLLVTPESKSSLSGMMQATGRVYVKYVNSLYHRTGTLWEGRFKSALVDNERYVLTCSRYIELNPVRAGMVNAASEYPWSSYRANAQGVQDIVVSPHFMYLQLGSDAEERQRAYRRLFRSHHEESDELGMIREITQRGGVIGNARFQQEIASMLKRRVVKHEHGGDRKSTGFRKKSSDLTP